jgi:hypothetical protein
LGGDTEKAALRYVREGDVDVERRTKNYLESPYELNFI